MTIFYKNKFSTLNHTIRYCFLFLLLPFQFFGQQNLILNGDFEEYWECPDDETQIERCKNVYNPLYYPPPNWSSTSDYFNSCSNSIVNIPNTFSGYQESRSGNGFVGLIVWKESSTNYYNEYFQLEFSDILKSGITYHMSIYCNLANLLEYTTKNIQFKFINTNNDYQTFLSDFMEPDFRNQSLIVDTMNWTEISFDYVAQGGEKYVIIGNFDSALNTDFEFLYDLPTINYPNFAYFYFDDASLTEINVPIIFPNVFTPNHDGVNDVFTFIQGSEQIQKIFILNRWGETVFETDKNLIWDGKDSKGIDLVEGTYFIRLEPKYYKEDKKEQYQGMIHLIR